MTNKQFYVAPDLESIYDVPSEVLCVSSTEDLTGPAYGGQEDEFIF